MDKLKELFYRVRDIPFAFVSGTAFDYRKAIESIETLNKGSCSAKHFYLGHLYEKEGLDVDYVSYVFFWEDQEYVPNELKNEAKHLPEQFHLALCLNGRDIDATYDIGLKDLGFPVNEWENQKISVEYTEKITHKTPQERISYTQKRAKGNGNLRRFYQLFNEWIEKNRKKSIYDKTPTNPRRLFKNIEGNSRRKRGLSNHRPSLQYKSREQKTC